MEVSTRCCAGLGEVRAKLLWEVISDPTYTERFSQPNWRAEQSSEHAVRQQPADFINKEGFLLGWGFCLFVWVWVLLLLLFCRLGCSPFLFQGLWSMSIWGQWFAHEARRAYPVSHPNSGRGSACHSDPPASSATVLESYWYGHTQISTFTF